MLGPGAGDPLQKMLKAAQAKEAADALMRERVAGEVDGQMDNGVCVNPLLRAAFGGERAEDIAEQQEAQSHDGDADAHLLHLLGRKA